MVFFVEVIKQKRSVYLSRISAKRCESSNRTRLWAFSIADIAEAVGESESRVRRWVSSKEIDPDNLLSLVEGIIAKRASKGMLFKSNKTDIEAHDSTQKT